MVMIELERGGAFNPGTTPSDQTSMAINANKANAAVDHFNNFSLAGGAGFSGSITWVISEVYLPERRAVLADFSLSRFFRV